MASLNDRITAGTVDEITTPAAGQRVVVSEDGDPGDKYIDIGKKLHESRVEIGVSGVQIWKKTYTTATTGILEVWDRDITLRLDEQSAGYSENFDFIFPESFKAGTVPNVHVECTYRTDADFTRWRARVFRETGLPDINEGGSNYTNEQVRVRFIMDTSPGSTQYSFVSIYAVGEFDDTP